MPDSRGHDLRGDSGLRRRRPAAHLAFLQSNDTVAFDRVVPAHYGGEVTVLELLTIILSHSTHHLKQAYWFIHNELGCALINPMTDEDLEGIVTPAALF